MKSLILWCYLAEPNSARTLFHCRNEAERAEVDRLVRNLGAYAQIRAAMQEKLGSTPEGILRAMTRVTDGSSDAWRETVDGNRGFVRMKVPGLPDEVTQLIRVNGKWCFYVPDTLGVTEPSAMEAIEQTTELHIKVLAEIAQDIRSGRLTSEESVGRAMRLRLHLAFMGWTLSRLSESPLFEQN